MIFITGDTHIPIDIQKLSSKQFPLQKELTEKDFVIICGDFGGVWNGGSEDKYWQKWLSEKNFTTLFVDGNHDNHDMLKNDFEEVDFYGGRAHKINDKLFHLMRGEVYSIDEKKVFAFGGASSHDKDKRKEGVNWWEDELPKEEDLLYAKENLEKNSWSVDFVISHSAPGSIQDMLGCKYEKNLLTDFFDELRGALRYEKWFFGHYHIDRQADERHIAVFNKVIFAK